MACRASLPGAWPSAERLGAELWDGQSWAASTPNANVALSAVSCGSVAQCLATGDLYNSQTRQTTLEGELYSGGTWTDEPGPAPTSNPVASSVGCAPTPAPLTCMAVGGWNLDDLWNQSSGTWTVTMPVTPTTPNGTTNGGWDLSNGVTCPAANECVGIGSIVAYGGLGSVKWSPLAEIWNGSTWAQMEVSGSITTDTGGFLSASCPTPTFCVAVGNKPPFNGSNNSTPVVASWGTPPRRRSLLGGL